MKDSVERISGNAFKIMLTPETAEERQAAIENIEPYYQHAIQRHFGEHIKPASLTLDKHDSFQVTLELLTEAGSI